MKFKWDNALTAILVVCAIVIAGVAVHREFFQTSIVPAQLPAAKPRYVDNWQSHLDDGAHLGAATASMQLIEFADFECPFCADFHKSWASFRERHPSQVALTYVHFPLTMHRFALPAARAAECAANQDRFEPMLDHLFDEQQYLGLKSWAELASAAGVPNLAAFSACIKKEDPLPRVERGKQLGSELGVKGTPTILVNGWLLGKPPDLRELEAMLGAIDAGKAPVSVLDQHP